MRQCPDALLVALSRLACSDSPSAPRGTRGCFGLAAILELTLHAESCKQKDRPNTKTSRTGGTARRAALVVDIVQPVTREFIRGLRGSLKGEPSALEILLDARQRERTL